jgi:hypothetical protein
MQPRADMLVTAHFHHCRMRPAGRGGLDGGSPWFRVRKGDDQSALMIGAQ